MIKRALLPLLLLAAASAPAQTSFPALALSASPDAYVGEIEVPFGETFTLYVCLTGPEGGPLTFDLDVIEWALLNSCCGGSPAIFIDTFPSETMTHAGDPTFAVTSDALTCVADDFVVLARVDFNWLYEPTGPFNLGAACLNVAWDCAGESHVVSGLPMHVIPLGITPAETDTWSGVKRTYR